MNSDTIGQIEQYVKEQTKGISPVHGFMHLRRTAIGAKWFTECFGGTKEDGDVAYVAGLIHDLKRPSTEKIDHTDISVNEAKKVLSMFSLDEIERKQIITLIGEHRVFHDVPLFQQSIFLSDKLLEQSGAYLVFRRNYYIGECEDFRTLPFEEAVILHWESKMKKFFPEQFHEKVRKLALSQFAWVKEFFDAFLQKKPWAQSIAKDFYAFGRDHRPDLDLLIQSYTSEHPETRRFQEEAVHYVEGEKYRFFKSLITIDTGNQ
jgi:HD superfamily phosphodiesterase